ncbi:hypothetical protein P7C73_g3690, partial [Tremellales sp. Uapishka_1]
MAEPIDLTGDSPSLSPPLRPSIRLHSRVRPSPDFPLDRPAQRRRLDPEEDRDDDEIVYTGARERGREERNSSPVQPPERRVRIMETARRRVVRSPRAFQAAVDDIDQRFAAERQAERRARLRRPSTPPQVRPLSPPPAGPARLGLGGAILRAAGRHIQFRRPPTVAAVPPPHQIPEQIPLVDYDRYHADMRRLDPFLERLEAFQQNVIARDRFAQPFGGVFAMGAGGGAGGARREEDIEAKLKRFTCPTFPSSPPGFTSNFNLEERDSELEKKRLAPDIEINKQGNEVVDLTRSIPRSRPAAKMETYLACLNCDEPLRLSSGYRGAEDRVWALRCGHLLDQRCLNVLSAPQTQEQLDGIKKYPPGNLDVLDGGTGTRKGRSRKKKTEPPPPLEYEWQCPVKGCHRAHWSVMDVQGTGEWTQMESAGAIMVYA